MRALRLFFPPLLVWVLGLALFTMMNAGHRIETNPITPINLEVLNVDSNDESSSRFLKSQPPSDYSENLQAIASKPLFSDTRRVFQVVEETEEVAEPIEPVKTEPAEEIRQPPNVKYLGFLRGADKIEALLVSTDSGNELWVREGQLFGAWGIEKITEKHVILSLNNTQHIVEISR